MSTELAPYIEFDINTQKYAISIQYIKEIVRWQTVSKLPYAKAHVKGVIHLRGSVIPVISLRKLFHYTEAAATKETRIILTHHAGHSFGIEVDAVHRMVVFDAIHPSPEKVGNMNGNMFSGIGVAANEMVAILRLDPLL